MVAHNIIENDEQLDLKCQLDHLSEFQVGFRNRKISNMALIKSFMQASFINNSDKNNESMALLSNLQQADIPQYMPYTLNNSTKYVRNYSKSTPMNNGISHQPQVAPTRRQRSVAKPGAVRAVSAVTQSLRATRKSTGSLPPPKINLTPTEDSDSEIEVIKESTVRRPRVNPIKPPPSSTVNKISPALKSSGNPAILLNINVRPQNLASPQLNMSTRKELDARVKTVLIKTAPEFIEFLMSEGLVRSVQHCATHRNYAGQPAKLKLGMFSDPKVHIVSGGYVWLAECCVRKYISVFSGSIFASYDEEKIPPTSIIKLVYHWSCQTAISNVETWVKIERNLISRVYQYLRCICSAVIHNKVYDFGVNFTDVELGIVSLGTTTADGLKKAVKVEILGLYDRNTKAFRLFACTPEPANSSRERFTRILKPVLQVVHPNATLICDYSVDPSTLNFKRVHMCNTDDAKDPQSNSNIMSYLRKHVPKMFQANLSQLTEYQVQLVLDELCWREKYAPTAAYCYEKIGNHISFITGKETENCGVVPLLKSIGENPHRSWRYKQVAGPKMPFAIPPPTILVATDIPTVHETQIPDVKVANPAVHSNKIITSSETSRLRAIQSNKLMASTEPIKQLRKLAPALPPTKNQSMAASLNQSIATPKKIESYSDVIRSNSIHDPGFQDLEQYFYSRLEGDLTLGTEVNSCNFKCTVCSEDFGNDNITFYTHLRLHVEGTTLEKENVSKACHYCCKYLEVGQVAAHIVNEHLMADIGQLWCRICCEQFFNANGLKTHMMKKHVEAEMPYRCGVCGYATSFFYDAIDHFDKVHKGSPYVQCRLCLAVKAITPANEASFALSFLQHCQKHSLKLACKNCQLTFYNKANHTEHAKEHLSCACVPNIIRYKAPSGCRMLEFRPVIRNGPIKTSTAETTCEPATGFAAMSFSLATYKKLKLAFTDEFDCLECGKTMQSPGHYKAYRRCTKCQYTTCCLAAFLQHNDLFHPGPNLSKKKHDLGNVTTLPNIMYCNCGFFSRSGNHLARHMSLMKHYTTEGPEPIDDDDDDNDNDNDDDDDDVPDIPDGFLMPVAVEMSEM